MASPNVTLNTNELKVNVTIAKPRFFDFRYGLAMIIFKIAAIIFPFDMTVEEEPERDCN